MKANPAVWAGGWHTGNPTAGWSPTSRQSCQPGLWSIPGLELVRTFSYLLDGSQPGLQIWNVALFNSANNHFFLWLANGKAVRCSNFSNPFLLLPISSARWVFWPWDSAAQNPDGESRRTEGQPGPEARRSRAQRGATLLGVGHICRTGGLIPFIQFQLTGLCCALPIFYQTRHSQHYVLGHTKNLDINNFTRLSRIQPHKVERFPVYLGWMPSWEEMTTQLIYSKVHSSYYAQSAKKAQSIREVSKHSQHDWSFKLWKYSWLNKSYQISYFVKVLYRKNTQPLNNTWYIIISLIPFICF